MDQIKTGKFIASLRKEKGFTQVSLANRLGISDKTVSKWERGKAMPESDTLVSISQYFNISLDYLMKEDNFVSGGVTSTDNSQTKSRSGREKRVFGAVLLLKSSSDK